ncbi:MAG: reverse transcriptase domain-containing protein [Chthoniobacter sp.]|nr:reverse transcriptase domain-containing protein [Chthoniobacter sp.]
MGLDPPVPAAGTHRDGFEVLEVADGDQDGDDTMPAAVRQPTRPPLAHVRSHSPTALFDSMTKPHDNDNNDAAASEIAMLAKVRKAAFVVAQGGPHAIQRASASLSSAPLAPLHAGTLAKLRSLHPTATEIMGDLPSDRAHSVAEIDPARLDRILRRRVHNGSAPGLSGTTGSHLVAMWEKASPDGRLGFQMLIRDICNGVFDGELKERLLACVLVPLAKKDNGVRPVAIAETLVRCAAFYMMSLIEDDMASFFPKIQFGVKLAGGSEAAAQLTRAELAYAATKHADVIALKIDFRNAFNAIHRARVWEALCRHPQAAPILKAFHWQYSESSPLLIYERGQLFAELRSTNGVRQGCPFAAFAFALTVQPLYEAALRESPSCNGFSIQDDFTIVGPSAEVMRAYDYLLSHAHAELGLELVTSKCQVYLPPTIVCPSICASIQAQCRTRSLSYDTKMESLGVMFGPDADVRAHCESAVDGSSHFFECISHPAMPVQTASLLLRYCALPKLGYLARTTRPELLLESARRFDQMALRAQTTILGQTEESLTSLQPRTGDPESIVHDPGDGDPPLGSQPLVTTNRVTAVTKDQLLQRIALPLSLGGLGLRSVESVRYAAYFASLQQILAYFARLHPELRESPQAFQRTQLYHELVHCQAELVKAGAATRFEDALRSSPASAPVESAPATTDNLPATSRPSASIVAAAPAPSRFPSPPLALTQSIDATWQNAARCNANTSHSNSSSRDGVPAFNGAKKLQYSLTRSLEASAWLHLFNSCGRYQQAILTSLTLNPSTSAWLTMPPLTSEPGYCIRDEDYRLAVRHRLGQLPFDDIRHEFCVGCARRNAETPSLLEDPDHAHSCAMQQGVSVRRRHDTLKLVLAELARSCGYHVEVEPRFPPTIEMRLDPVTGERVQRATQPLARGDLLLIRDNTRQLVDVTVVRPTTLTHLRGPATTGSHLRPLAAADQAEKHKHQTYDAECAKHGWKLVPFALESLGAKGTEATQLLQRLSAHSVDRSPAAFLAHADRMLSSALQVGNAHVASQGVADMLLQSYRAESASSPLRFAPGRNQQRRTAASLRQEARSGTGIGISSILHADYRVARIGTRHQEGGGGGRSSSVAA